MTKDKTESKKTSITTGLEVIYTIFIGIMVAFFFGFGIAAFYPQPEYPEYPARLDSIYSSVKTEDNLTEAEKAEVKALNDQYNAETEAYQETISNYNRNVSIITLTLAVVALAISLIMLDSIKLISNGLMLGGVFTLIYSMVRGFMIDDLKITFVIVSIGLAVSIFLGYMKFIKQHTPKATKQ